MCGDEIESPKIDQLCCKKESCKEEFTANQIDLWKMENPEKVKDMNKRAYIGRKENSAQPKSL